MTIPITESTRDITWLKVKDKDPTVWLETSNSIDESDDTLDGWITD